MTNLNESGSVARSHQPWVGCILATAVILGVGLVRMRSVSPVVVPESTAKFQVDLNRANVGELMALPELGPQISERIVAQRESRGPFQSVEQLREVPGIGPATLRTIRDHLFVAAPDSNDESLAKF